MTLQVELKKQIIELNKEGVPLSKIVEDLEVAIELVFMAILRLTYRQAEVYKYHSHGYTPDEIGDFLGITKETVRKTICNIKIKLKLQKASEITAYYWCVWFGGSLESQRNQLIASICSVVLLFSIFIGIDNSRFRIRLRRQEIEYIM